ncbi:ABC transporter permease [Enterococcus termitis]|uniref:ABC transporter permease n=1 Tax=Enterococcus termitis TaxID=332950 RepID=A0A1E5H0K8_9ENTE|nr:ABC transporter permease [Enterococcus termitis]OEG18413.1 hypothetical protein BCR25_16435 [Enterococcus termitis]OJG96976.1 hypothetical protein RV18_GL001325 [Enterococcus termitis]
MINLLKSDGYRIVKSSLCFYSISGLILLGAFFGFLGSSSTDTAKDLIESGLSNGSMLIPIFLTNIFMVCWGHDFNYRVVNNSLIAGVSRKTFFLSKVVLTFLLTLLFVSVYAVSLMVTTILLKGGFPLDVAIKPFLVQLPLYLAASCLGICLFNVFQASYTSVAAFIAIAFIGDTILSNIISNYFEKFDVLLDTLFFSNLRSITDLTVFTSEQLQTALLSSLIYGLIALAVSFNVFRNREFK